MAVGYIGGRLSAAESERSERPDRRPLSSVGEISESRLLLTAESERSERPDR